MPLDQANWQINLLAADKTAQAFRSVDQRMKALDTQTKATGTAMNAGFAMAARAMGPLVAAFSAAAVAQKVWAAGMKAANMGEQAEQIGLTTDQLQAYRLAAAQAGIEAEQMDAAMMRLSRSMGSANEGNDEAIARFEKLGVKVLDANGNLRKAADVMPEVARGLLGISSETERSATMQELFGRSGARMVTVLETLAQGNDRVVQTAKDHGAVIGEDVIKAWDKLDDQLKITGAQADVTLAKLGAPIATWALEKVAGYLSTINDLLTHIDRYNSSGGSMGARQRREQVSSLESEVASLEKERASIEKLMNHPARAGADNSRLTQQMASVTERMNQARDALAAAQRVVGNNAINNQLGLPDVPPPVTGRELGAKPGGGAGNPISNSARKAGEKAGADAIRESQRQMDELVALIEKQRKAADAIEDRFGTGAETLARETAELAEIQHLLAPETVQRAMKDLTDKADDQARAVRGAAGGFDGYLAGIEQAVAEMDRANSAFEYGKQTVDLLSDALTELATTGEINFQKLLGSFVNMIIQMEMRAAASNVWGALGGAGGLLGLLGFGGVSSSAPLSFGAGGTGIDLAGGLAGGWMPGFADGGRPPLGRLSVVGERGPELFVPDSAGTIFNREQIAGMGGGATNIVIQQTVHVGEYVTTEQYTSGIRAVKKAAEDGAQAALINRKKRGGLQDVF